MEKYSLICYNCKKEIRYFADDITCFSCFCHTAVGYFVECRNCEELNDVKNVPWSVDNDLIRLRVNDFDPKILNLMINK
jgi:hypothetical protein